MKTIKEVLQNYRDYEVPLDDRFGARLCGFLTLQQMEELGFSYDDPDKAKTHTPKAWTEEDILAQLKEDVEFGWEKTCNEPGLSSALMHAVVKSWCKVLENEFVDFEDYGSYGKPLFKEVAKKYGWRLYGEDE